jgi:hypothetical protein
MERKKKYNQWHRQDSTITLSKRDILPFSPKECRSMATMIPDLMLEQIANDGERVFYLAARKLPEEYTIFYSYRYYEVPDAYSEKF